MAVVHAHDFRPGRAVHRRRLLMVFAAVVVFLGVEFAAALISGSLALLSDAGHMLTDAVGLGMALAAMTVAERTARADHRTYGRYRLEMLATVANAVLLVGVGVYAVVEGVGRLGEPPDVETGLMLVVASMGLAVNLVGWLVLRRSAGESLNVEGAMLEVLADLLGSVGAVLAAVLIRYVGWVEADAVFGIALGVFIIPRAVRLGRRALRVLMQHAPEGLDVRGLVGALGALPDVIDVHDLHVWTLTSGMDVASVHLTVSEPADLHGVLDRARSIIEGGFDLAHATIQIEPESHRDCVEVGW